MAAPKGAQCQGRARPVTISSTIPSAKYSWSGSPLIFSNGNTAIATLVRDRFGLGGAGKPEPSDDPAARDRFAAQVREVMGHEQVTTQNLVVAKIDVARGLVMVRGAVPGSKGGWVLVRDAVKKAAPKDLPKPGAFKARAATHKESA